MPEDIYTYIITEQACHRLGLTWIAATGVEERFGCVLLLEALALRRPS